MIEMNRWDSRGVKVCNCKCVQCGTKYESANREMAEVKTLAIKVVKCEEPVEPIMRFTSHFNKVPKVMADPTKPTNEGSELMHFRSRINLS